MGPRNHFNREVPSDPTDTSFASWKSDPLVCGKLRAMSYLCIWYLEQIFYSYPRKLRSKDYYWFNVRDQPYSNDSYLWYNLLATWIHWPTFCKCPPFWAFSNLHLYQWHSLDSKWLDWGSLWYQYNLLGCHLKSWEAFSGTRSRHYCSKDHPHPLSWAYHCGFG